MTLVTLVMVVMVVMVTWLDKPGDGDGGGENPGHVADHYATKQLWEETHYWNHLRRKQ